MIQDRRELRRLRQEWSGVRSIQGKIQALLNFGFAFHELRNISHNLTLLQAFGVFGDVLQQLHDEGAFASRSTQLGSLMKASRKALPWSNYRLVDHGREDRNRGAHDSTVLERDDCWKYIDAIEHELVTWKILLKHIPFNH